MHDRNRDFNINLTTEEEEEKKITCTHTCTHSCTHTCVLTLTVSHTLMYFLFQITVSSFQVTSVHNTQSQCKSIKN